MGPYNFKSYYQSQVFIISGKVAKPEHLSIAKQKLCDLLKHDFQA
jgi:hypothetical protein